MLLILNHEKLVEMKNKICGAILKCWKPAHTELIIKQDWFKKVFKEWL
jgi:hypothetical protein